MIDEKKIEEAKEAFIADKKILGVIAINDLACGFKEGANWAINWYIDNLWHPASEEPKKDSTILCEYLNCDNKKVYADIDLEREYDCYKSSLSNITLWLYLDDLLKGGK